MFISPSTLLHNWDSIGSVEEDSHRLPPSLADQLENVRSQYDAQVRRFEEARAELREILGQIKHGRSQREILHSSEFARLQARLESMPVIEQAKGILMAEQRCGPDEAFDLLRRASQRANIKVRVLAEQIVEQVRAQPSDSAAIPLPITGNPSSLSADG